MRDVRIVEISNPFHPEERREITLAPRPLESVADCLLRAGLSADGYAIRLGEQVIDSSEAGFYLAMPGATLVCCSAAAGGLGKTLAMVAVLAVSAAFTGGLGDIVESVLWTAAGIASSATAGIVAAAIAIGGNLLISATMGQGAGTAKQASVTYDPSGPKTLAQPGTPIPKGYGTMGWGGALIASFVDQDGQDEYLNLLVSFGWGVAAGLANILLNGKPIGSYPDLAYAMRLGQNNQTPIPGFDRVVNTYPQQVELLAANGPTIVTGTGLGTTGLQIAVKFPGGLMRTDSGGNPKEVSLAYQIKISPSGQNNWTVPIFPRTTTDVYTIDGNGYRHYPFWVVMPTDRYAGSGIVYSTDTNPSAHHPGESWSMTQSVKVYNVDNSNYTYSQQFQGEWQMTADITLDLQSVTDWWGGYRIVSNMTNQSFYDVVNIYGLAEGKWDVSVYKYGAGPHNQTTPPGDGYMTDPHYTADAWLWDVSELQFTDLAYPNQILLGIRALATTQISGADIVVNANVTHFPGEDTVIPAALAGYELDNPAIVAYDMIMNPLYGMAATQPANLPIQIDVPAFARWASFCDEPVPASAGGTSRRFVFAGVFDTGGSNAWGCLQQVALMSRASIVQEGSLYSVWIDAPTDVTQVFTEGNMKQGSYSESFLDFDSRATELEVEFADSARSWRTDLPVSIQTSTTLNSGLQPKITRTNLLGCVTRDQAWQWAYFHLLSTETLLRTAKWECGLEAVSCKRGSVVGVQQRQWALGGRIQAGSTISTLVIDRTDLPPFGSNAGWTLGVVHPVVNVGAARIQSIVPAGPGIYLVTFTANLPPSRIMRLKGPAGNEAAVLGISQVSGANGNSATIKFNAGTFNPTDVCTLYNYDVLDTQLVQGVSGTSVAIIGNFLQVPTPDAAYVYGQSGGVAPYKLFRVMGIKQSGDMSYEIQAIDYAPVIYEDLIPQLGEVVSTPVVNAGVTGLTLVETLQNTIIGTPTGESQSIVAVSWTPGPNTAGADVYGQLDGGVWNQMDRVYSSGYNFRASQGDIWTIQVVGIDRLGVESSKATAPTASIGITGPGGCPGDVIGLTGVYAVSANSPISAVLTWYGAAAATSYEVRYNTDPGNQDWNTGALLATAVTTTTYTDPGEKPGLYMVKAIAANKLLSQNPATFAFAQSSSSIAGQGSIIPTQTPTYNATCSGQSNGSSWFINFQIPAQTILRSDGKSFPLVYGSIGLAGNQPSTTYYFYSRIRLSDGALQALFISGANGQLVWITANASGYNPEAGGDTLPTAPSSLAAIQASSDGYCTVPVILVTTGAVGSTATINYGGLAGHPCPHAEELVRLAAGVDIPVGEVRPGDSLLGYSFAHGRPIPRRVLEVHKAEAETWHLPGGYRVSPRHPVQLCLHAKPSGSWVRPHEIAPYHREPGTRVMIRLREDEWDEQNYYLVGRGEWLLMHNGGTSVS